MRKTSKTLVIILGLVVVCSGCGKVNKALTRQQKKVEQQMDEQVKKGMEKINLPGQADQRQRQIDQEQEQTE